MKRTFWVILLCYKALPISIHAQSSPSALASLPNKNGLTIMRQASETTQEFAKRIFSENELIDSAREYLWNDEALGQKIIFFARLEDSKIESIILEPLGKYKYLINTLNIGECGDITLRIVTHFFDDINNDNKNELFVVYACRMRDTFTQTDENGDKEILPVHRDFYYATIVHKIQNEQNKAVYKKFKEFEFPELKQEEFDHYTAKEIKSYVLNSYLKNNPR